VAPSTMRMMTSDPQHTVEYTLSPSLVSPDSCIGLAMCTEGKYIAGSKSRCPNRAYTPQGRLQERGAARPRLGELKLGMSSGNHTRTSLFT